MMRQHQRGKNMCKDNNLCVNKTQHAPSQELTMSVMLFTLDSHNIKNLEKIQRRRFLWAFTHKRIAFRALLSPVQRLKIFRCQRTCQSLYMLRSAPRLAAHSLLRIYGPPWAPSCFSRLPSLLAQDQRLKTPQHFAAPPRLIHPRHPTQSSRTLWTSRDFFSKSARFSADARAPMLRQLLYIR